MRVAKDFRPLVKAARRAGWQVVDKSRHVWLLAPDGEHTVSVPCTPSDHRALLNCRATLRRCGLDV